MGRNEEIDDKNWILKTQFQFNTRRQTRDSYATKFIKFRLEININGQSVNL